MVISNQYIMKTAKVLTGTTKTKETSKKIMKRKYGLEVGKLYVEQSTLLEPNNFIPSWVSEMSVIGAGSWR
jgi:nucleoside diphosphate kinase